MWSWYRLTKACITNSCIMHDNERRHGRFRLVQHIVLPLGVILGRSRRPVVSENFPVVCEGILKSNPYLPDDSRDADSANRMVVTRWSNLCTMKRWEAIHSLYVHGLRAIDSQRASGAYFEIFADSCLVSHSISSWGDSSVIDSCKPALNIALRNINLILLRSVNKFSHVVEIGRLRA